ncbi:MAG: hypothetical protein GXY33_14645 [Phycisphaerae bacterium]|nr:hypothetical protein [Phycisphaerae bacterium]
MALTDDFGVSMSVEDFERRFLAFHKQLFASTEFAFDDVTTHVFKPPPGFYQVDHSFIHDGTDWHLYYVTGDIRKSDQYVQCFSQRDWEGAARHTVEPGNGHAVGPDLRSLKFKENVFFEAQGRFDMVTRGVCSLFRCGGRYGMLYDVRGEDYIGMSLAWSHDLSHWELGPDNPALSPPAWACPGSTCKDPHVMLIDGVYLIYYIVMDQDGYCCVALASTTDWKRFDDEGCVFRSAPMLRGTMGIESPAVILRDGVWHLFFTYGPGLWHSISRTPTAFVACRGKSAWFVGRGLYCMGPFHATEIIQDQDGQWWLTTDRKEETRRLNRQAGRLCYRGTFGDEKTLEEGIYLSRIRWHGDQPILEKPR